MNLGRRWVGLALALAVPSSLVIVGQLRGWRGGEVSLWQALSFAAVAGLISMSIIEVLKRLLPIRARFHERQLVAWITSREESSFYVFEGSVRLGRPVPFDLSPQGSADLILAALHGPTIGVVQSAGVLAERFPRGQGPEDGARSLRGVKRPSRSGVADITNLPADQFCGQLAALLGRLQEENEFTSALMGPFVGVVVGRDSAFPRDFTEAPWWSSPGAQAEVSASIDSLQAWLTGRWRHLVFVSSWFVSGLAATVALLLGAYPDGRPTVYLAVAWVGGAVSAWFGRDVMRLVAGRQR